MPSTSTPFRVGSPWNYINAFFPAYLGGSRIDFSLRASQYSLHKLVDIKICCEERESVYVPKSELPVSSRGLQPLSCVSPVFASKMLLQNIDILTFTDLLLILV